MKKKGITITGVIEYLLVILVVLDCYTIYSVAITDYYFPEISAVFILILTIGKFMHNGKLSKKILYCFILYLVLIGMFMIFSVSSNVLGSFVARFGVMLPCFLFAFTLYREEGNPYRLLDKYVNIIVFLSITSVFFWIMASQLRLIIPTGYTNAQWGGKYRYPTYFGIYTERQVSSFLFYKGLRNQSIFAEGPMFSLCLCIAIAIELFLPKNKNVYNYPRLKLCIGKHAIIGDGNRTNWKLVILIVALVTTVTTTGYIVLILMLMMRYCLTHPQNRVAHVLKLFIGICIAIVGIVTIYFIFIEKSTSGSWKTRLDDFTAGFSTWKTALFFGTGYVNSEVIQGYMSSFRSSNLGYSNSVMDVLAQGGLVLFAIYILPIVGSLFKAIRNRNWSNAAFITVFTVEFAFTIFTYRIIMLMILGFLYSDLFVLYAQKSSKRFEPCNL